jgi:IMP cyclohydrolase
MARYSWTNTPQENLALLASNSYPGRLLVVGWTSVGAAVLAYALTGRSDGSRNRRLVVADNVVSTEVVDTSLPVGDPELTVYDAMRRAGDVEVVSNGAHTDTIVRYLRCGRSFAEAMRSVTFEQDPPHFTPRIAGFCNVGPKRDGLPSFGLSVVGRNPLSNSVFPKVYTGAKEIPGVGSCVHTYQEDGDPLPSFSEWPLSLPVEDTAADMASMLWENLNEDNRVSVAAKVIALDGTASFAVINRHA